MIFKEEHGHHQWLMSMLLRPKGACYALGAIHDAAALVVETEDGGHTVSASGTFQRGGHLIRVPNASRACPGSGGKTRRCAAGIQLAAGSTYFVLMEPSPA